MLRDAVGKNDGVLTNGPTWDISGGRYALGFDGTDDKVLASHRLGTAVSKCTLAIWMRKLASGDVVISSIGSETTLSRFHISWFSDGNIYWTVENGSATFGQVSQSFSSDWKHYVLQYDGAALSNETRLKAFVDGKQLSLTYNGTIPATAISNSVVTIGAGSGVFSKGQIDDVRIYDRPLSDSEIRLLATRRGIAYEPKRTRKWYFRGFSPKKKLLEAKITSTIPGSYQTGYAPRDGEPVYPELWKNCVGAWSAGLGATGGILRDQSGLDNHGTLTNMDPGTDWVISNGSYALDFDGVNDSVDIGRPAVIDNLINDYTITAWVRPTGSFANFRNIIAKGDLISLQFGIIVPSTGIWRAQFTDANDVTGGQLTLNKWSFVAYKMSAGVATTYQDGLAVNSGSRTTSTKAASFEIGRDTPNNRNFLGNIDDVRLYNRPLSDSEIKTLATRRNIAYEYKRPRTLFRAYDPIKQVGVGKITSIIPGGYHTGVGGVNNEPAYPELTKGLVGGWCPSLGVTGGLLRDNSGQGNHGTLTNMDPGTDWVVSGGRYALDFDGSNDYTVTSRLLKDCPNNYTVCLWANIRALPTSGNLQSILSSYDVVGSNHTGLDFRLYNNSGTQSIGFIMGDNNGGPAGNDQAYTLPTNTWISLIARRLGSSLNCFLNGVSITTHSAPEGIANTKSFYIGTFGPYTPFGGAFLERYFNGVLDDIRIYDRALSDNEIRLLASRRGIGYDYKTHRSYSKTQSSGLLKRLILTGQT